MCWFSKTSHPDAKSKDLDPLQPTASFQSAMGQTVQILSFGKRNSEAGFISGSTVREHWPAPCCFYQCCRLLPKERMNFKKWAAEEFPFSYCYPQPLPTLLIDNLFKVNFPNPVEGVIGLAVNSSCKAAQAVTESQCKLLTAFWMHTNTRTDDPKGWLRTHFIQYAFSSKWF